MRLSGDLIVLEKQRKNFAANQKRLNLPPLSHTKNQLL